MGQLKPGWIIASVCAVFVFISIGYGMGKKAGQSAANAGASLAPAGAPLSTLQIEPIQPQEELNSITATPAITGPTASESSSTSTIASASEGGAPTASGEAERIRQIQLALRQAGFDPGPVDGRMGARTKVAIRDFQLANGLQADGKVGPRTWNRLESFYNQAQDPTKQ